MYVYLIRSLSHPDQRYIGLTEDLKTRLAAHNAGRSPLDLKFPTAGGVGKLIACDRVNQISVEKQVR